MKKVISIYFQVHKNKHPVLCVFFKWYHLGGLPKMLDDKILRKKKKKQTKNSLQFILFEESNEKLEI